MSQSDTSIAEQKIVQYLEEARAMETSLVSVLQSQIAIAPRSAHRDALEDHLEETRNHAARLRQRLRDLEHGPNPMQVVFGLTETLIGQTVALSKAPLDLLRGSGGEEKVLKDAKDACASEALEIATYTAIERVARDVGDERTAKLAASIRGDEERMLERLLRAIPTLADAVVGVEVHDEPSYDISQTGAADAVRAVAGEARDIAQGAQSTAARAKDRVTGAVPAADDLPIADYDTHTAEEIIGRLRTLTQRQLDMVARYERENADRSTVLKRVDALQHEEPWEGYDELSVADIEAALEDADEQRIDDVATYERAHKNRAGVLRIAERRSTHATA